MIEIVTEPEIYSSAQAKEYAKKLRQIIRYLDISDCDMEKGGMRLEANISLIINNQQSMINKKLPNYKVELKILILSGFWRGGLSMRLRDRKRFWKREKHRVQETRGYNAEKNITFTQRIKEGAADYRYFPDRIYHRSDLTMNGLGK